MYYQSRYHLTNGRLSIALDSLTGELLELVYAGNGENVIKNHCYSLPQPLAILCDGGKICLRPGDAEAISAHPKLRPEICVAEDGRSAAVTYRALWDGERPMDVRAAYTVELPEGSDESVWRLKLHNGSEKELEEVRFPCINGVYLGESWQDNAMVYPYVCGIKVDDPVTTFGASKVKVHWRWQNYRYVYTVGHMAKAFPEGSFGMEESYSGLLSMKWVDYYGKDFGLYFACHDPALRVCTLRADTFGAECPGMNFFVGHPLDLRMGDDWESPDFVAALHAGDWHAGAKKYRAFHRGFSPAETACPEWFKKSAGLMAHYDFKYQNGGIVHRFKDISGLLKEAEEMGLNHLLLSGWHKDGFDNGFPEYVPDAELGSEDELRSQIGSVIENGGHVCFYINSRLANMKYDHLKDFIAANSVVKKDGSLEVEQYGTGNLRFAVECIGSAGWRKKLTDTVAYITGDIGTDGMYLDQLVMGYPGLCRNPDHDHSFGEWNVWYQRALKEMHRQRAESGKERMSIIHEGVSDSYGPLVSGQLVSTFSYHHCGAYPQLYRYTFPEQFLVEMLYPNKNLAMRPVHVAQASRAILDRAFRTGMYYWIYDLVDDNTFTRDPEQHAYLKEMIRLRKFWLESFGQGVFCDEEYVAEMPDGVEVACYEMDNGLLLACSNTSGVEQPLTVRNTAPGSAVWYTAESLPGGKAVAESGKTFTMPAAPLSLLRIEYG